MVGKSIIDLDLLTASSKGDKEKFKILTSLGCDPDQKRTIFNKAPIHYV